MNELGIFLYIAAFVLVVGLMIWFKLKQQEKSIKEMFKSLPVIGFLIILWDDAKNKYF